MAYCLGISRYVLNSELVWTVMTIPGGIIMLLSLLLFESEFLHIVAISYTALVINELIMVALEITTWHTYMVLSELGTAVVYFGSMTILPAYFGRWLQPLASPSSQTDHSRHVFRIDHTFRLQGGHNCGRVELPALHDQSIPPSLQASCICQGVWYMTHAYF